MSHASALWAELDRNLPAAFELRQSLHAEPDLSGDETLTRDRILAALPNGPAPHKVAETGAVARIGLPGPAIGIRGEMDALPVHENTSVAWSSRRAGVMHACGHDAHLAALVAVARAIHSIGGPMPLLVVLQPREETYPSGAQDIAQHGVLTAEDCKAMIGVHVQPTLDSGTVACVPGGVNACADEFEIVVHGAAGHAAYPHLTSDPLLALAAIVTSLQSVVSRSVDPMSSAVLGVSSLSAGDAANVIPDHARATGTLRALSTATRELLHKRLVDVAENVARAHECTAEVTITNGEPVLRNDPTLVSSIQRVLTDRDVTLSPDLRSLGADDFSYFAEQYPAAMLFVGTETSDRLHSPTFLPSDADVACVARTMLAGYLGAAHSLHQ
jgi:amidohydrolase